MKCVYDSQKECVGALECGQECFVEDMKSGD